MSKKSYIFSEIEKKWQDFWINSQVYSWHHQESRANTFIVDTPPPTVSGDLHLGHIYSYTQTDFIVRFHRMLGKNIYYPIGFDDNGLPTERLVEKKYSIKASYKNRDKFINMCNSVIELEEKKFLEVLCSIGLSIDTKLVYKTISDQSKTLSQMSFLDLVNKGQVYRSEEPILWDISDQTALSYADIEEKEFEVYKNNINFSDIDNNHYQIMTTRPEMIFACVAVFFHPHDQRYIHLEGKYLIVPITNEKVPVLKDVRVKPNKGTGLVMCATFGDLLDVLWWKQYNLSTKIILNKSGIIDFGNLFSEKKEIILMFQGLNIKDARHKILLMLQDKKYLFSQTKGTHKIKCAERSGTPLEILTTKQWFINILDHKQCLLDNINKINFFPKNMKFRLIEWINNIAWDWCISRQRYFGVQFPVWYSNRKTELGKPIFATINQLPVDPINDLPEGYNKDEVIPDFDVMDTWATSSISPQLNSLGINDNFFVDIEKHKKLFPANLRSQGHEILRTWAFYTILKSHLHEDNIPWSNLMVSGWCLAEDRSKMSKSKGNIIHPELLISQYGADVIRYWVSKSKLGNDTTYSTDTMTQGKKLLNKIWNAANFIKTILDNSILSQKIDIKQILKQDNINITFDKSIIIQLSKLIDEYHVFMNNYDYSSAMHILENFFWHEFCDNYLEIVKMRAYNFEFLVNQLSAISTICYVMYMLLKLFAPFLPHITEEIYHDIFISYNLSDSLYSIHEIGSFSTKSFHFKFDLSNSELEQINNMMNIIQIIRKYKSDKNLSIKFELNIVEIKVYLADDLLNDLKNVTSIKNLHYVDNFSSNLNLFSFNDVSINIIM